MEELEESKRLNGSDIQIDAPPSRDFVKQSTNLEQNRSAIFSDVIYQELPRGPQVLSKQTHSLEVPLSVQLGFGNKQTELHGPVKKPNCDLLPMQIETVQNENESLHSAAGAPSEPYVATLEDPVEEREEHA